MFEPEALKGCKTELQMCVDLTGHTKILYTTGSLRLVIDFTTVATKLIRLMLKWALANSYQIAGVSLITLVNIERLTR